MAKYSKCEDVQKLFNIVNKLLNQGVYGFEIHRFVDMELDLHRRLIDDGYVLIGNVRYKVVPDEYSDEEISF